MTPHTHSRFRDAEAPGARSAATAFTLDAPLSRRDWVRIASGGAAVLAGIAVMGTTACPQAGAQAIAITVHASEECGCCHKWAAHLTKSGFNVTTKLEKDMEATKNALQVPADLRSCHTAEANGYVFEGHVPAEQIQKFLAERSKEHGLAVPGMPGGSPGMEDQPKVAYQVLAFHADGTTRVFANV